MIYLRDDDHVWKECLKIIFRYAIIAIGVCAAVVGFLELTYRAVDIEMDQRSTAAENARAWASEVGR